MKLLKSDFQTVVDLLFSARNYIIFSSPAITDEIAEALVQRKSMGIEVMVLIEFTENTFRSGFGDIKAITKIRVAQIPIVNKQNFNIYFLIIDDGGYFYFPKSLFLEEEGTSYDLFPMEKSQVKKMKVLLCLFDSKKPEYNDLLDEVGIELVSEISKQINIIKPNDCIILEKKLTSDPPLKPNLGRTLEVYKAKFQIAELKFKGANLHVKKIKLPGKALPFKDDHLKRSIEANLRLFTDIPEKDFLEPFFKIKIDLDIIREHFMFYIKSRDKNIIRRSDKGEFESAILEIKKKIEKIKTELLNKLQEEIGNSRTRIKKNLFDFLIDNPPEEFAGYKDTVLVNEIKNATNKIIGSIKFPNSKDLLEEMKLDYHYYEITWEDLNNQEVLKELQKHGLISKVEKSYIHEMAIGAETIK